MYITMCRYDFGTSPELLFKPCKQFTDDDPTQGDLGSDSDGDDGQCYLGAEGRSYAWDPVIRLVPQREASVEEKKAEKEARVASRRDDAKKMESPVVVDKRGIEIEELV